LPFFLIGAIGGFALELILPGIILALMFIFTILGFTVVDPDSGDKDETPIVNTGTLHT
jgi:hypothetical protein